MLFLFVMLFCEMRIVDTNARISGSMNWSSNGLYHNLEAVDVSFRGHSEHEMR